MTRSFLFRLLAEGISPSDVLTKDADVAGGKYTTYGSNRLPVFVKLALGLSPADSVWFVIEPHTAAAAVEDDLPSSWCAIKDGNKSQDSQSAA